MHTMTDILPARAFRIELCDTPELTDALRERAEARYARVLERQLGSAEAVCDTLQLLEQLQEAAPEDVPPDAQAVCQRWLKAARAASEAAMQGLGVAESGYFAVHVQ
ncbi:Uncharacterised protein [uncultured Comamonas sp.]|nr:Uncharacterised protein [uncultured Comamonas sp.]